MAREAGAQWAGGKRGKAGARWGRQTRGRACRTVARTRELVDLSVREGVLSWAVNQSDSSFKEITLAGLQRWQEWQLGNPWEAISQGEMKVA